MEKYRCSYFFICLALAQLCFGMVEIPDLSEDMEIHKCVALIIRRIELVHSTDVTLVNVKVSLAKELHLLMDHPVKFISRSFDWPKNTLFNSVYVIHCSDYFTFAQGLDLVRRDQFWNPRAKFVIIVEYVKDFLQEISVFLIYNHIYDVALVAYGDDDHVAVYTFGLEHDECDRPLFKVLQLLSRCTEIHSFHNIFVGARETSLRGCHVKFMSHEYWPFVSFGGRKAIENYLLGLIKEFENITVNVINFGTVEQFGDRNENFTYTGMLHEIETYNVEGAIGGYVLTFNRMSNLDFINPFMVDYHKIIIARAKLLSKWNGLLKQIGVHTIWFIFGTFCIVCVIVILTEIFKKGQQDNIRDILLVWGYFLGNITQKYSTKSGIPYRVLVLTILLYVFIISCTMQASLLSATTEPIRDYQPDTLKQVLANYQPIVSPHQLAYLQTNPAINLTNAKMTCNLTLDCMVQVMSNADERLFTVASDIYHKSYIWKFADENGQLKVHKIRDSIGTLLQTMYIRRGSSLAEPFNRLFLRVGSGGLIDKFLDRINFDEQLKYKFHARGHKKPQSLKGLKGVFMLLLSGYFISTISFIFEYLRDRYFLQ